MASLSRDPENENIALDQIDQREYTSGSEPLDRSPSAEFSLPPVDGGRDAWLLLAACWGVEAMTFGFGFSFGVFQEYYSNNAPFAGSSGIAAIGTTTTGVLYLGTPFVNALCRLYPRQARWYTLAGLFMSSLALALSSFCTTIPQLVVSQGILFGIGGCFAYCPCTLYIDEWFVKRKGLAYGIVWGAAGLGGAIFPPMLNALLRNVGFQTTTRICAGILFGSSAPLAFFIKPRLPYSAVTQNRRLNMRFVTSKLFILYQTANVVQALGYFLPSIYLPSYARTSFEASTFLSALTVMLVNLAASVGLMVMGSLSDRLTVTTCTLISAMGVATSVLLIWGLSASLPALYVFCICYGLFAGSWASIWPGIMREVSNRSEEAGLGLSDPVMVQGHLCIGRGVGNIISGPLSDSLIRGMPWQGKTLGGFGSGYGPLILFTGLTGLMSGMNFVWKKLGFF
ncbi:major facilitator superfamily domain-containing protein [Stachybotrys elegans]|uniref:Major facilitator superfamily domain-containing protein n=1 Tax=Stachybotrys elegans TaxID=80388 RepID=A0A8K0SF52_9HYPO|nr:major facilitator superfamily domain-containing protein [Stachybotrys elegans]